jgi:hypothetical protein
MCDYASGTGRKQLNEGIDNTFVLSRVSCLKETHPLFFADIQLVMQAAFGARERSGSGAMIHVETADNSHRLSACIGTAGILHDVLKPWFFGSGVNSLEIGLGGRLVRRPDSGLGT